jgi:hypothetical protein
LQEILDKGAYMESDYGMLDFDEPKKEQAQSPVPASRLNGQPLPPPPVVPASKRNL